MKKFLSSKLCSLSLIIPMYMLLSCGSNESAPGSFELDCSKATPASSDFVIESLFSGAEILCGNGPSINGISEAIFRIYKKPKTNGTGAEGEEEVESEPQQRARVSVRPRTNGSVDTSSEDIPEENREEYPGILTPKEDFCTDAGGVVSIKFRSRCPGLPKDTVGGITLMSGSVAPAVYNVTLKAPTDI